MDKPLSPYPGPQQSPDPCPRAGTVTPGLSSHQSARISKYFPTHRCMCVGVGVVFTRMKGMPRQAGNRKLFSVHICPQGEKSRAERSVLLKCHIQVRETTERSKMKWRGKARRLHAGRGCERESSHAHVTRTLLGTEVPGLLPWRSSGDRRTPSSLLGGKASQVTISVTTRNTHGLQPS